MKKRIEYIDIAKGIAILSVIFGHSFAYWLPGSSFNKWIYLYHMPLFLCTSGFFYRRPVSWLENAKKKSLSLLLPYGIINLLRCVLFIAKRGLHKGVKAERFYPMLYGSGSADKIDLQLLPIKRVGMTWFLLALFFCILIYSALDLAAEQFGFPLWAAVLLLAWASFQLNDKVWLPFSIQPAMGGMIFFHFGRMLRERKVLETPLREIPPILPLLGLLFCALELKYGWIGMHKNSYGGITSILGACSCCYFLLLLSKRLQNVPLAGAGLRWFGRNSMLIYAFHAMDEYVLAPITGVIRPVKSISDTAAAVLGGGIRTCLLTAAVLVFLLARGKIRTVLKQR